MTDSVNICKMESVSVMPVYVIKIPLSNLVIVWFIVAILTELNFLLDHGPIKASDNYEVDFRTKFSHAEFSSFCILASTCARTDASYVPRHGEKSLMKSISCY